MSFGGGGSSTQKVVTKPWSEVQREALQQGWNAAGGILNSPQSYYPGSTVAPQSPWTQAGLSGLVSSALNDTTGQAANYYGNMAMGGGWDLNRSGALNSAMNGGLNANNPMLAKVYNGGLNVGQNQVLRQGLNGGLDIAENPYLKQAASGQLKDQYSQALSDTLAGKYLGPNQYMAAALQPSLDQAKQNYQTSTIPMMDSEFARAGRFGSGAHENASTQNQNSFAKALTDTSGQLAYQNYANERANQMAASNADLAAQENAYGRQMQGLGMDLGRQQQNVANRLSASGQDIARQQQNAALQMQGINTDLARQQANSALRMQGIGMDQQRMLANQGVRMQALGMAPQLQQMQYTPAQMMMAAGGVQDQYNQNLLNDDINRWNFYNTEPQNRIGGYMGIVNGNGYGQQQQGGGQQQPNALQGMLGGGLAGGALFGWPGAMAGGLLGGFGSVLG